ncbi:phage shock protein operon transcriptional activator [Parendozoicomonas haliclonae]|uniref:Psp operon transcriptional activator n=1 Tax=Parendozoicomonas haliclonae TaxID=1960125 RepID=A0A1X7AKM5_9GAMM|nr:phage shock protein operon transcriptional activator [Parendozoicomonas haliclonae]SMA44083.1 Psp operon transcriptional activator [Parendozoicomonas haliclonae]
MPTGKKNLIGSSPAFLEMQEAVSQYARHQRPVLIIGERGTGKEEIANRLHFLSPRWQQNLIKLNCAAFNDELLDSELFGHESGAFTGARQTRTGLFEEADGGTLFLDELATMGARLQEKLLRVIEYGEFYRVGSSKPINVDVRVVAATNEHLPTLAAQGKFRHDLLDRLAFDVIAVPPLRARRDDILPLAHHFAMGMIHELTDGYGLEDFEGFTDEVIETLYSYRWPGNIRELKNAVERSVCRSAPGVPVDTLVLDPFHSPWLEALDQSPTPAATEQPQEPTQSTAEEIRIETVQKGIFEQAISQLQRQKAVSMKKILKQVEEDLLKSALQASQYNQKRTADMLGLSYDQIRSLIRKYAPKKERSA